MKNGNYLFTSESVSEGHPDKICDRISDSVVDTYLNVDPHARAGIETLVTTNLIVLAGESRCSGDVPNEKIEEIARQAIKDIGYEQENFHWANSDVQVHIHMQSADIAQGVDGFGNKDEGAGDQGIMFGFVQFANGMTAHLHKNIAAKNGIEVHGSSGVLYIGQSRAGKIWHRDGAELKLAGSLFDYPDTAHTSLLTDFDEDGWEVQRTRLTDSVEAFVEAVDKGTPALCSGADVAKALELAIAVRESHRRGIVKVELPLADRELKVIPSVRRYVGRRASEGTEAFMDFIQGYKR